MTTVTAPTLFDQFNDFGDACDKPRGMILAVPDQTELEMNLRLVDEEYNKEFLTALAKYRENPSLENFVEMTDGLVDTVYVLMQLARTLGIPFNAAWDEVHASNMQKVVNGKVIRREDGKILKPEGWKPPALWDICYAEYTKRMVAEGQGGLGDGVKK